MEISAISEISDNKELFADNMSPFGQINNSYSDMAAEQVIKSFDKDFDGVLSAAELKLPEETFNALDKDASGALDKNEIKEKVNEIGGKILSSKSFGNLLSSLPGASKGLNILDGLQG